MAKNRWVLAFSLVAFLAPTWWFVKRTPDTYIASGQLVMDDRKAGLVLEENGNAGKDIGYYRTIFASQAYLDRVLSGLGEGGLPGRNAAERREYLVAHVDLTEGAVPSFLRVESRTTAAGLSFAIARAAIDSLISFCRDVENEEAAKAVAAIREQIEVCVRKRDEIQRDKNRYTDVAKLASSGDYAGLNALEKTYQEELVKYELDKANLEAQRTYFRTLDSAVNGRGRGDNDSAAASARRELAGYEREKEKMLRLGIAVGPGSDLALKIQAAEERIVRLSKRGEGGQDLAQLNQWQAMRKELSSTQAENDLKKARLEAFRKAVIAYREGHPDLGKQEFEIQQLDNLLDRYAETQKRLTERLEDAIIQLQSKSGGLKLVDAPRAPNRPVARKDYAFFAISLAAALAFGVGVSLFRELMDDSVKTTEDVEKRLALTLLGTIPHIIVKRSDLEITRNANRQRNGGKTRWASNKYPELVLQRPGEESVIAEAYRSLRTNILFSSPDKQVQTMLITSSGPHEGKSLTMANTALSFAQQGEPTLIIDTDLRRPIGHHLFGMERAPGFGDLLLEGGAGLDQAIRDVPGTSLKIMTAGAYTPNPAELLGSQRMDRLIADLRARYRYILFDTPPVMAVTDACILASKVDGVMLVIRAGTTSLAAAERTLQALRNVNAKVLGCILNDLDLTKGYSSYGYYKHYYHYYRTRRD